MVDDKLFMHIYNNYNVELDTVDLLVTHNLPPGHVELFTEYRFFSTDLPLLGMVSIHPTLSNPIQSHSIPVAKLISPLD